MGTADSRAVAADVPPRATVLLMTVAAALGLGAAGGVVVFLTQVERPVKGPS
ncbi:MAG: hypothetical protein M3276_03360 [Actinomycetota bacterium]|nr:hypothetical protein [Actinomycetota bacterium]